MDPQAVDYSVEALEVVVEEVVNRGVDQKRVQKHDIAEDRLVVVLVRVRSVPDLSLKKIPVLAEDPEQAEGDKDDEDVDF